MGIPTLNKDEEATVLSLATRYDMTGKNTIFMVPAYIAEDDAATRGNLIEKAQLAEHLVELQFFKDVTAEEEFAPFKKTVEELKKRSVKLYLLNQEYGMGLFRAVGDVWDDEDKKMYEKRIARHSSDTEFAASVDIVQADIEALKERIKQKL